jgi:uncharacterized protein (DUF2267 family)
MSETGIAAFDSTIQTTNIWLNELAERLGWMDRHQAYHALRTVLHALRDRLTVEEAASLGAQLPLLVRGFYYEGWHPHGKPIRQRKKEEFLAPIEAAFRNDPAADPEEVARAVFHLLTMHVTAGEIDSIRRSLPEDIRSLWWRI